MMAADARMALFWATVGVTAACSGDDKKPTVDTYLAVEVLQGIDQTNAWYANVAGHAASSPWSNLPPSPSSSTCVVWSFVPDGQPVAISPAPSLSIDGVGTYDLVEYNDGSVEVVGGRPALPSAPFMQAGAAVNLAIGTGTVTSEVPQWLALSAPASGASVSLGSDIQVAWQPGGEDQVLITLSLYSSSYAYRGTLVCEGPDSGAFTIPANGAPAASDVALARLSLRGQRAVRTQLGKTQVDLMVVQFTTRDYPTQ